MTRCSKREWWLILPYSYIPKQHGTFDPLYHEINFETHSEHQEKPLQSQSNRKILHKPIITHNRSAGPEPTTVEAGVSHSQLLRRSAEEAASESH